MRHPGSRQDPTADNTDTYAWTAKDAPGALTVAADWIPGEVPANGPNFFGWDDKARYYIHIDNTGDGRPDVSYRYQFKTTVKNKNSFLYALPGASGYDDPKLNVVQRYSIVRETWSYHGKQVHGAREDHRARPAVGSAEHRSQDDAELLGVRERGRQDGSVTARRCSPASATIRSSSTWARPSTASTSAT